MPRHWYLRHIGECPVCGRDKSFRVRQYTPRPTNPSDRVTHIPDTATYDHCDGV